MAIEPKRLNTATLLYDDAADVDGANDLIPVASAANSFKVAKVGPDVLAQKFLESSIDGATERTTLDGTEFLPGQTAGGGAGSTFKVTPANVAKYANTRNGIINVKDYGANSTGASGSGAAFTSAFAALTNNSILDIPAGTYDLSDLAADISLAGKSNITIRGYGAILDVGASKNRKILLGDATSGITVLGVTFKRWDRGIASSALSNTITDVTIRDCVFDSCREGGIVLNCVLKSAKAINCTFKDIGSDATAEMARGVMFGKSDDTFEYADQDDYLVDGCTFINIIGTHASEKEVHAIDCYGNRMRVVNNYIENVNATVTTTACEGIYVKAREAVIQGNTLIDAGANAFIQIKGEGTGATAGLMRATKVMGNSLKWVSRSAMGISVQKSYTEVLDNTLIDPATPSTTPVVNCNAGADHLKIIGNVAHGGTAVTYFYARSSHIEVRDNAVISPAYAGSSAWAAFYHQTSSTAATPSDDVAYINNRLVIDADFTATGSNYFVRILNAGSNAITNLRVIGNHATGIGGASGTWRLTTGETNTGSPAHANWIYKDNTTDASWRGIANYNQLTSGQTPASIILDDPVVVGGASLATGTTLVDDESGVTIDNTGASGTVTHVLPAALVGRSFTFVRTAAHALRIDPNTTQTIGAEGAGKYIELGTLGATVKLRCRVAGTWTIESQTGTVTVEP